MCRLFEPLALERDHALIARDIAALLDRQRQMAPAEKLGSRRRCDQLRRVEARKCAQPVRRIEIDDEHVDDAVAARLQLQPAVELQRRAEQRRKRRRLAEERARQASDNHAGRESYRSTAEPHDAAAQIERSRPRRAAPDHRGLRRRPARTRLRARLEIRHPPTVPKHQDNMPFCACRRFSASSKTTDCGPSITVIGDFLAAMRRQTMHEDCILCRRGHQLCIDLIGASRL